MRAIVIPKNMEVFDMKIYEVELRFKEFRIAYWEAYHEIPTIIKTFNPDLVVG